MNGNKLSVSYGDIMPSQPEFWRDETTYRLTGGFHLDATDLQHGMIVDKGCPLAINFATRTAKPCKAVRLAAAAAANAVNLSVSKGSLVKVGDVLAFGDEKKAITAIDKTDAAKDKVTIESTFGEAIGIGVVLHECTADSADPKNKANALNYRRMHITEASATAQTVTAVGQAYEIFGSRLPNPCSVKDKENLGDRFMFID